MTSRLNGHRGAIGIALLVTLASCSSPTEKALPPGYVPAGDPLPAEAEAARQAHGIDRERVLVRDGCYYVYDEDGSVAALSRADGSGRVCTG